MAKTTRWTIIKENDGSLNGQKLAIYDSIQELGRKATSEQLYRPVEGKIKSGYQKYIKTGKPSKMTGRKVVDNYGSPSGQKKPGYKLLYDFVAIT
ncbi:MAG: hypothetical protein ACKO37_05085 [Vampirovibrionales bacterium]